jgi:hypothetical protein
MRKKMLLLTLALVATASLATPRTGTATTYVSCPICTTYSDGSQCCVPCVCDGKGHVLACTDLYCPPEDGGID